MASTSSAPAPESVHDVVIVGSGPAGLTAALYTARADLAPVVFEGQAAGGQLMLTTEVENYPGFPEGRMGPQLMADMREQAARFGADLRAVDVDRIDLSRRPFSIEVGDALHHTRTLIISTGATARWLGLEREKELIGRGLSSCATCDGFFFRDKRIAVVGGGDSAMEEATFLTKFASEVTIVHRRSELRASRIMQERAFKNDKISFRFDAEVVAYRGEAALDGVVLKDLRTGEREEMAVDGLFVAIGHDPTTTLFAGQLELDEDNYIVVDEPSTATSVAGVFAAGDVVDRHYRQAVTAAGMGCKAAIDAERMLGVDAHNW